MDCPIYYKRIKVKKDLAAKVKQFNRLNEIDLDDPALG